jgi:hypothetical protein
MLSPQGRHQHGSQRDVDEKSDHQVLENVLHPAGKGPDILHESGTVFEVAMAGPKRRGKGHEDNDNGKRR